MRVALYAGVALAGLVASPAFAQSEPIATAAKGADKTIVLAQADQTPTSTTPPSGNTVQEVVVYGIRASQISAIAAKRQNTDIVEALTAEDIGKLPDESIADSIARLPGLASQRDNNGRWQDISVNGLPPAMSATLLNGREQASTDNNRVTQFDQYPAEIMNQVLVYKTGDAALVGSAISTVDMQTIRPLEYGKQVFSVGAQGEYDTRGPLQPGADAWGERMNATYVGQFFGNTLGVMLAASRMVAPNQIYAQHPYSFNEPDNVVTGLQDQVRSDTLTRDGYVATIEWKPTDRLKFTLDGFSSDYNDEAVIRGAEVQTACCGNATEVGTPTNGVSSWIVAPQLENYDYTDKARLKSLGFTADYDIGSGWKLRADFNYSQADRNNDRIELYNGFGLNGSQNLSTVTLRSGAGAGGMIGASNFSENIGSPSVVALGENLPWQQGWWGAGPTWPGSNVNGKNLGSLYGSAYFQRILSTDLIRATNWSIDKEMSGFVSHLTFGVSYSERSKDYIDHEGIGILTSQNESQAIPSNWLQAPTSLSPFGLPSMISIDAKAAWNSGAYQYLERPDKVGNNWDVREHVLTPYVEAKISTELMGRPLTGNVGLQAVNTDQRVNGLQQLGGWPNYTFVPFSVDTNYWDFLPSLNLKWKLQDNQDVRLGIGRSLARARFDTMGGGYTINYNVSNANATTLANSPWSGQIGNPRLKPWISDDLDLTYERYFAPGEGISIEGFFKNIETFIYDKTIVYNFQSYFNANPVTPAPQEFLGPISQYENANGGLVYGATLSGNVYLKHLSPALDGFGVSATVTQLQSTIHIPDPATSPSGQIPEMSHFLGNVSLYWERWGYEIRINDRWRTSYVQEVPNFDGTLQAIEGAPENTIDLQASYTFATGTFKGLSMHFSAENLTDTPMNSYVGKASYPEYYKLFGTNLLFGMNYKF